MAWELKINNTHDVLAELADSHQTHFFENSEFFCSQ